MTFLFCSLKCSDHTGLLSAQLSLTWGDPCAWHFSVVMENSYFALLTALSVNLYLNVSILIHFFQYHFTHVLHFLLIVKFYAIIHLLKSWIGLQFWYILPFKILSGINVYYYYCFCCCYCIPSLFSIGFVLTVALGRAVPFLTSLCSHLAVPTHPIPSDSPLALQSPWWGHRELE